MPDISRYPWDLLAAIPKSAVRRGRSARRAIERAIDLERLGPALGEILDRNVSLVAHTLEPDCLPIEGDDVHLELADGTARIAVRVDPALATTGVAHLLGRPVDIARVDGALEPELFGALASIVIECGRRTRRGTALRLRFTPSPDPGVRVDATALVDDRSYAVSAWASATKEPSDADPREALAVLGTLPVTLTCVAAINEETPGQIESLGPGDAWLPGPGWLTDPAIGNARYSGLCVLASPLADVGLAADSSPDGRLVLTGQRRELVPRTEARAGLEATMTNADDTIEQTALDAPLAIRIEVGTVTLTAREWADLKPGDVIETGQRLMEPVVLRVAGQAIARGELVNVDGELGVRIRELLGQER